MKIKNSELMAILEDVEADLAKAFDSSKGNFAKAEEREFVEEGRKAKEHDGYHDSPEHHDKEVLPEVHKASPSASESSTSASRSARKAEDSAHGGPEWSKVREGSHSSTAQKAERSASESSTTSGSLSKDSPDFGDKSPSDGSPSAASEGSASGGDKSPEDLHSELSAEAQPDQAPPENGDQPQDPGAMQSYSPEELMSEYLKLPPEELDIHLQAAMAAKEQQAGAQQQPAPDAMAQPPASPSPAAPAPAPSPSPLAQNENRLDAVSPSKANGGQNRLLDVKPTDAKSAGPSRLADVAPSKEHMESTDPATKGNKAMGKSEQEQDNLKKSEAEKDSLIKTLQEDVEILTKAVKHVLETPVRKAVTSISFIPRADAAPAPAAEEKKAPQNLSDVRARLNQLTQDPKLAKSDRELITAWYERRASLDQLAKFFE